MVVGIVVDLSEVAPACLVEPQADNLNPSGSLRRWSRATWAIRSAETPSLEGVERRVRKQKC